MKNLNPKNLSDRLNSSNPPLVLDVMSDDHFAKTHIPGAKNVCIYEIDFLEKAAELADSKDTAIVVYGLNDKFEAAGKAFEQLSQDGYSKLEVLRGGLEEWASSGYPVECVQDTTAPENSKRVIDTEQSILRWTGRNLLNQHTGTLAVTHGLLEVNENGLVSGLVETDFDTLVCTDISDPKMNQVLLNHLKSADFFLASEFPTAKFVLSEVEPIEQATAGRPNIKVKGDLTLRGQTRSIEFEAIFQRLQDQLIFQANLEIDRTRWNSKYGSGRFFEALGKHLVNDHISLQIQLVA